MAFETVAEADKYSRTQLIKGVVEAIVAESPVLNLLPFAEILGNSLTYNREATPGRKKPLPFPPSPPPSRFWAATPTSTTSSLSPAPTSKTSKPKSWQ